MDVTSGHVRDDFISPIYAVCCMKALGLALDRKSPQGVLRITDMAG